MPRDIPLANGSLLVGLDRTYQIRDLFYPTIGGENHAVNFPFRFGVWVDGQLSWVGEGWELILDYQDDTLVTRVTARHAGVGLLLECHDAVDFHENAFIRRIVVVNQRETRRECRLFFHHDFRISGNDIGDTALYDPRLRCVIHYKRQRYFLANLSVGGVAGVQQYATGVKAYDGLEGTWRDAEDGVLGGNPIAQGSVDSTIGTSLWLEPGGRGECYYWLAAGQSHREVRILNQLIMEKTPELLLSRTASYWSLWTRCAGGSEKSDLSPACQRLYRRSLLMIRTHIDNNGAVVAATDSETLQWGRDTYSYLWPRDGARVAYALDRAGYFELTKRFFFFCHEIIREEGYFLHKYNPDGSLASSWHPWVKAGQPQIPIQEDGTALVIWALWHHYVRFRNTEFIKVLYRPLITRAAEFMVMYRDPATGLPLPSYDLWEERQGVLTFTTGAVHGGLRAAAAFARAFGETDRADHYEAVAAEIRKGMETHLWHEKSQRFARMITPAGDGFDLDLTVDASLCGCFAFGAFDPRDPKVVKTMDAVARALEIKTPVGGVARYEGDRYHAVEPASPAVPGNPWFICTLWLAQHRIAQATTLEELQPARELLEWAEAHALPSGVLAEQIHPRSGLPLSVSPLTWSHAEYVIAYLNYIEKYQSFTTCPECGRPHARSEAGRRSAGCDPLPDPFATG